MVVSLAFIIKLFMKEMRIILYDKIKDTFTDGITDEKNGICCKFSLNNNQMDFNEL